MFKIIMKPASTGRLVPMPGDKNLSLREAVWRADLYKKKNPKATFSVVNEINEEVEYEV